MKGVNNLCWNSATMMEAVQEYLDKRYMPNVLVTDVTWKCPGGSQGSSGTFEIVVKEKEPAK